jgi:hypothetical protein
MGNFNFTGNMLFPKADSQRPFIKSFSGGKDKKTPMLSLNLGIKASDNNMAFIEMFGMEQEVIKTMSKDNEKLEISWNDRFDEGSVKVVANYKKYTVDLGEGFERQDFITPYDAVLYLKENLGKYSGKICVTGQWDREWYKDRYYDKFKAQNFYAVDDNAKNRLGLTVDIYYEKNSIDETDFKSEKRIYLNAHVKQYINKDDGSKYIPQQFVLDGTKIDFNNEKHVELFDYRKKYMKTDKKTVVHMNWDVTYVNGADTVEFTSDQLTKAQREQVELGLATLESFKPKGDIFGNKIVEFRLSKPNLIGDFADGLVDTEMTVREFEEQIHVPNATEEKLDEVMNKATNIAKADEKTSDERTVDEEDLF